MGDLLRILGTEGPFAQYLPGFRPREAQVEMAQAVKQAINRKGCLVAEAGTGTGKTLAYLVPAVLSGNKVIVSTATKTLQDQLFRKDLPLVRRALAVPFKAVLLKGRANYLCQYRLENTLGFKAGYSPREAQDLEAIRRWSELTRTGDIAEVTEVPESSLLWPSVTSTGDNCLGQECPQYDGCFLARARRAAQDADILVINHHLLWADWTLKNDGFGELLPDCEAIVVDEAHQFVESAAQFLGLSISSRQFLGLADDIRVEQLKSAKDMPKLLEQAETLQQVTAKLGQALGEPPRREAWHRVAEDSAVIKILAELRRHLHEVEAILKEAAVHSKGLESCWKHCTELGVRLETFSKDEGGEAVRWFEVYKHRFSLNRTPLAIADEFARFRSRSQAAWIFASATLTVSGRFDHFVGQLGLADAECRAWESPFDYRNRCLLFLPPGLPDPVVDSFTEAVVRSAVPVLKASRGRAFMLFTSHQALAQAAALIAQHLDYPLFVQGNQPKAALLEAFKQAGNGILLGTGSFWEGVDVPGPALSCVIIDKLPFASPSDPVLNARLEALRRAGLNPFATYQLPAAIIALKQGIGRLIRDQDDRGVLVLCDPRILSRAYGKIFLNSLPEMPRTRSLAEVQRFFSSAFEKEVVV